MKFGGRGLFIHEWMADVGGFEAGSFEQRFLERKEAEHFVELFGHFWDPTFVPGPDLRADVVDLFGFGECVTDGFGETEVEARVIDEEKHVRPDCSDCFEHFIELLFEPVVVLEDFNDAHDSGFFDPVFRVAFAECGQFRAAYAVDF